MGFLQGHILLAFTEKIQQKCVFKKALHEGASVFGITGPATDLMTRAFLFLKNAWQG